MTNVLLALVALLAFLTTRVLALLHYRWWFKQGFVGDASVHFSIIRQLQKDPKSQYIEQFLIAPEPMAYPTGFHAIARRFPLDVLRTHPYLPSLLISITLFGVFIGYLTFLADRVLQASPAFLPVALACCLVAPTQHCFGGNAITYLGLSERSLARLTTGLAYAATCIGCLTGDGVSLGLAAVSGAAACLSSIFARQVLLFLLPVLAILLGSWTPVVLLGGMLLLSVAGGRKRFLHSFRHTLLHWFCYVKFTKKGRITRQGLSELQKWEFPGGRITWDAIRKNLFTKEPSRALLLNIELPLAFLALLFIPQPTGWLACLAAPALVYLATSTPWLSFLGEGYRYVEYSLVLLCPIVIARLADLSPGGAAIFVPLGLAAAIAITRHIRKAREQHPALDSVSDRLSAFLSSFSMPDHAVVFPITMRLGADITARRAGWKSYWWQPGLQLPEIFKEYIEEYPFLKRDWRPLFQKDQVTHVLCQKSAFAHISWSYPLKQLRLIAEDQYYMAFSVPAALRGTNRLPQDTRRLVVLQTGAPGTFPETARLIAACVRLVPGVQVAVVAAPQSLALYRRCPYVKAVFGKTDLQTAARWLRDRQPDAVVNASWPQDAWTDAMAEHSGANACITAETRPGESQTQSLQRLVAHLGADKAYAKIPPRVWTTGEEQQTITTLLGEKGFTPHRDIALIISPCATAEACATAVAGLSVLCRQPGGPKLALAGGGPPHALATKFLSRGKVPFATLPDGENPGLWGPLAAACGCAVVLDWETSWLLAAAKANHLVLAGGMRPLGWMPQSPTCSALLLPLACRGCGERCRFDQPFCVLGLSPAVIAKTVTRCLAEPGNGPRVFIPQKQDYLPTPGMPGWQALQDVPEQVAVSVLPPQ